MRDDVYEIALLMRIAKGMCAGQNYVGRNIGYWL